MSAAVPLSVRPVKSNRDWNRFFEFRHDLYRRDPNAVTPMKFMERKLLDADRHPFYQHASSQPFLAESGGEVVGRIVAIKDQMHNEYHRDAVGFFGFFECIDDATVAGELLGTASSWLSRHGCNALRGPVNPSMKSDFGVLVQGFESPPFVMMAHSRPYYERLLQKNGLESIREFNAYFYDANTTETVAFERESEQSDRRAQILERYPRLRIGDVSPVNFESTLREINELGNRVRSEGWGFVPLTEAELKFMIEQLRPVLDPRTILTAYWDDKLVGYCINIPDINWALQKSIGKYDWVRFPQFMFWLKKTKRTRVIALGADVEYRHRGVGILLSTEMRYRGLRSHYRQWEFSWIDSENVASIRATSRTMPLEHYKIYRLYQRPIS